MKKKIAVFDIDGTLFRRSLFIELFYALVKERTFSRAAYEEVKKQYLRWQDRKAGYEEYVESMLRVFDAQIKGARASDVRRLSREVVKRSKHRVYVFTRDLIKKLRTDHTLIAISGSPMEMIKEFNRYWKFDYVFGEVHEIRRDRYTGRVTSDPVQEGKDVILKKFLAAKGWSLRGSVGVGDTGSDISFLKLVSRPICFNPNRALFAYARRHKWTIMVERKDMVYTIA